MSGKVSWLNGQPRSFPKVDRLFSKIKLSTQFNRRDTQHFVKIQKRMLHAVFP